MITPNYERIVIVRSPTRMEKLIERYNSKAQAKFYIESSGGNFADYVAEHDRFYRSMDAVFEQSQNMFKTKMIDRGFLPNYIFSPEEIVVAVGQDGLVANTAKYVDGIPIVGVNPDPDRYDGFLLPFNPNNYSNALKSLVNGSINCRSVTMAAARLNDGQKLLAFNDFFVGASSHVSSRYALSFNGKTENQSSSGVLISTGAGSTGWLSSIFNMARSVNAFLEESQDHVKSKMDSPGSKSKLSVLEKGNGELREQKLNWESESLIFVVREPFLSVSSGVSLTMGKIESQNPLFIESRMPFDGRIFSDGIEQDFMDFNAGASVEIGLAKEQANLVMVS